MTEKLWVLTYNEGWEIGYWRPWNCVKIAHFSSVAFWLIILMLLLLLCWMADSLLSMIRILSCWVISFINLIHFYQHFELTSLFRNVRKHVRERSRVPLVTHVISTTCDLNNMWSQQHVISTTSYTIVQQTSNDEVVTWVLNDKFYNHVLIHEGKRTLHWIGANFRNFSRIYCFWGICKS